MVRKIPCRKHHGVRNPEQQNEKRLLKKDVDAAPLNVDDQPVPRSARTISELMKKAKEPASTSQKKINKTKSSSNAKKLVKVDVKVAKGEKPVPKFEQKKGESDNAFLYRVNQICDNVKKEAAFEKKFGVDVNRNAETGKVESVVKRSQDPLESMVKTVRQEKKRKKLLKKVKPKNEKTETQAPKLTKTQKWSIKCREKKKKKKLKKVADVDPILTDDVEFGETVHAPPTLTVPKYGDNRNEASKPASKGLLLNSLFVKKPTGKELNSNTKISSKDLSNLSTSKVIDRTGKRKKLPAPLRKELDNQQKEAIENYKSLKLQKHKEIA